MLSELIKPFLLGGTIIAGSKGLSKISTPAVASLLGGLPTGIIVAFFLKSNKKEEFFNGYQYHSFILFLTIATIHYLMKYTKLNKSIICIFGMLIWAIISYLLLNYLGLT